MELFLPGICLNWWSVPWGWMDGYSQHQGGISSTSSEGKGTEGHE